MIVNILGTKYTITFKDYDKDKEFYENNLSGYQTYHDKKIVICNLKTHPNLDNPTEATCKYYEKQVLRHEIIHAFFCESGLNNNSVHYDGPWSNNEEMVDWFALNGPKIMQAWKQAKAI